MVIAKRFFFWSLKLSEILGNHDPMEIDVLASPQRGSGSASGCRIHFNMGRLFVGKSTVLFLT